MVKVVLFLSALKVEVYGFIYVGFWGFGLWFFCHQLASIFNLQVFNESYV